MNLKAIAADSLRNSLGNETEAVEQLFQVLALEFIRFVQRHFDEPKNCLSSADKFWYKIRSISY
jgi:hypothetical protein